MQKYRGTPFPHLQLAVSLLLTAFAFSAPADILIAPDQAMREAWPGAEIHKESVLLTAGQKQQATQRAGHPITDNVFTFFRAEKGGQTIGYGGLHTSRVRTKDETSLYLISPEGRLKGIEIIAFYEPPDYLPAKPWLKQFQEKSLTDPLKLRQDIPVITGATLTSQSITRSARIMLAVWDVRYATREKNLAERPNSSPPASPAPTKGAGK